MRKVACLAVFMALMMLVPVQAGENVSIQQSQPQDDYRQPTEENKTLYMFWNESNSKAWTHFRKMDNESRNLLMEEVDNGVINIDLRFRMDPVLAKRFTWTPMVYLEDLSIYSSKEIGPTIMTIKDCL